MDDTQSEEIIDKYFNELHEKGLINYAGPEVGIFWLYPDFSGVAYDNMQLVNGERRTDPLAKITMHDEYWEQAVLTNKVKNSKGLQPPKDYRDWPRGRIAKKIGTNQYEVLVGESWADNEKAINLIKTKFGYKNKPLTPVTVTGYDIGKDLK